MEQRAGASPARPIKHQRNQKNGDDCRWCVPLMIALVILSIVFSVWLIVFGGGAGGIG